MLQLGEIKQQLINRLLTDIGRTIDYFQALIVSDSDLHNELILIEARHNEVDKRRLQGTIKDEDLQFEYNRIRASLLSMINELDHELLNPHFQEEKIQKELKPTKNQGNILYHIPDVMEVSKEAKCVIRIAFDEEILVENFEVTVETEIQQIRVSEVMQVDMIDPSENEYFHIRTYSTKEQIVDIDAYTEWVYYVKPLREGVYPLILKVAVIELVREKERKREIVLEEHIQIVTETKEEASVLSFKTSDHSIQIGDSISTPPLSPGLESMPSDSSKESMSSVEDRPRMKMEESSDGEKRSVQKNAKKKPSPREDKRKQKSPSREVRPSRKRIPIGRVLMFVGLFVASSWILWESGTTLENPDLRPINDNTTDTTESDFAPTIAFPMDSIICTIDSITLLEQLYKVYPLAYESSENLSADGVEKFYLLLTFLHAQCPSLVGPNFTVERTPTDIAKWYHQRVGLQEVAGTQSIDSIPDGSILFGVSLEESGAPLDIDGVLESGKVDRIEIYLKENLKGFENNLVYLVASISLIKEK